MSETMALKVGEERPIHLPAGRSWTPEVGGMASAIDVRKLWPADPYPQDDEEADRRDRPEPDEVFMIRGKAPGSATVRFVPKRAPEERREVRVEVGA
jgi:hypothetical protein